jgi:Icc-related predicted phosphoesterase
VWPGHPPDGSPALARLVEALEPELVVCGHLHVVEPAETTLGTARVVNPGAGGLVLEV